VKPEKLKRASVADQLIGLRAEIRSLRTEVQQLAGLRGLIESIADRIDPAMLESHWQRIWRLLKP